MEFICYPKCSTCQKAKKWLDENKIEYTDVVFNMMPKYFTLGELQKVYEVILNRKLLDPAFRRIIANKVEKTGEMKTGGGHRPSRLFKDRGGK